MLCYERFVSLFCFVGGGLVPFLKFHFWECVVNKVLRMASLHKVFFKWGNGPFYWNVSFVFFFWRVCSKEPFFAPGSLRASSPSDLGCQGSPFYLCDKTSVVLFFCEVVVWERLGHWPSFFVKNRPQPETRTTWASVWIGERVLIE